MLDFKIISDKAKWEKFLLKSDQVSFLQSWNWGVFQQNLGNQIFRLGIYYNKKFIGLVLAIKIKSKRAIYLEIPGGPVIDWQDKKIVPVVLAKLKDLGEKEGAAFIRMRPNITFAPPIKLVKSPMHLHAEMTWVLDLDKSAEEILKNMRKNTRYSLKLAGRLGIKVEESESLADVKKLFLLQTETAKRHHFVPFSLGYLQKQFLAFKLDGQIKLFKASYQGQILAISFFIFYGREAVYHYSGSSGENSKVPASYVLQWEAILAAKKVGLPVYNFWGIAPDNRSRHRFSGVTVFKTGFGGRKVAYWPAHDLIIRPFKYWPNYIFESFRKWWRHL